MKRLKRNRKRQQGQAIVEYIIIIVIVAVAALTVMSLFSNTIREKIAGVVTVFGGEGAEDAVSQDSLEVLQELDANGGDIGGNSN